MRSALLAIVALAVSTPAFAADRPSRATRDMEKAAERFNDPQVQDALAGGLNTMLGAVLDLPIGNFVRALEPLNGGKRIKVRGNTVREFVSRDDRDFEGKMRAGTRTLVRGFGVLTSALASAMPEFEAAADKMEGAMEDFEKGLSKPRKR